MPLILSKSNRMEALAEVLAETLRPPLASPLAPEIIVVQSLGMRRWLSLQLAEKHGICANCQFPFAKQLVDDIFKIALPQIKQNGFFERQAMTWRMMKLLPPLLSLPAFAPVRNYASGPSADLKLLQLAEKIAGVFDQYIVFRPQMILGWERGAGDDWQALLWRELVKGGRHQHQAAQGQALAALLQNVKSSSDCFLLPVRNKWGGQGEGRLFHRLPQRISIFGISSLPPFYVQLFGALAQQTEVHIFLLDPTRELWAHIISDAEEDRMRRKLKNPQLTAADLHADEKNSLLASLGKTGRDFQDLVLELEPDEVREFYVAPQESADDLPSAEGADTTPLFPGQRQADRTLLATLQNDIFILSDPVEKRLVAPGDHSIQVHSCHSPMREMEVLHDQLLALLEQHPALAPRDIVVMMPEVKTYAPFIEAVFGSAESSEKQIPFTIADRGLRAENHLVDTFLQILELTRSRFGAGSVLEILESPAVQRRHDLAEAHLETIRVWVERVGIRWGIDAAHRQRLGLPALEQNTWRAGLRRLLLGYALPGRREQLFADILPYDEIEGGQAEILGNFAEFAEKLFALAEQLVKPRTMCEWQTLFFRLLDDFFAVEETGESQLHILRKALDSLKTTVDTTEFDGEITSEVMLAYLTRLLEAEESVSGFITGKVTFCALRPMRSVPFQVVCLAGMNDASYPRPQKNIGFDLVAMQPQTGDRSTRHEDRYLFLEAILSAREVLYLSYVGQSVRDNSPLPPSVLVSELLDYLERGFELAGKNLIEDHLVTRHRLQAFSPSYFSQGKLWSYSAENCAASRASQQERMAPAAFFQKKLSEPADEWRTVELDALVKFFGNPAEFLLRNRLGLHLRDVKALLNETEVLEVDALTRHHVRDFLAEKKLMGMADERVLHILRAGGQSALGQIGECHSRQFAAEVSGFTKIVQAHMTAPTRPEVALRHKIGPWELAGTLRGLYPHHLLRYRCADIKPKDILQIWFQHLTLNLVQPDSISVLIGLDKKITFAPVENGGEILRRLLEIYGEGLRAPLKFFPKTSFAFAKRKFQPGKTAKASPHEVAAKEWFGNEDSDDGVGERENPYFKLCFQHGPSPLDEEWQKLTEEICAPILHQMQEEAL